MSNPNAGPPEQFRSRRLDDLFGDEPFLSPTMKARRLHEASAPPIGSQSNVARLLPDISTEEAGALWRIRVGAEAAIEAPPTPAPAERGASARPVQNGAERAPSLRMHSAPPAAVAANAVECASVRFSEAAALLRADCPQDKTAEADAIRRFKNEVLTRWFKKVPARDTESGEDN